MDYELLFPSRFIKAVDLKGKDVTITISSAQMEALPDEKGQERIVDGEKMKVKDKGIVGIARSDKQWVLNRTNALCLVAMFGRDTDGWIGKRVTLFPATVRGADGQPTPAVRVKGSPDIAEAITFSLKLPRKKPIKTRLLPTGKGATTAAQQPAVDVSDNMPPDDDAPEPGSEG